MPSISTIFSNFSGKTPAVSSEIAPPKECATTGALPPTRSMRAMRSGMCSTREYVLPSAHSESPWPRRSQASTW